MPQTLEPKALVLPAHFKGLVDGTDDNSDTMLLKIIFDETEIRLMTLALALALSLILAQACFAFIAITALTLDLYRGCVVTVIATAAAVAEAWRSRGFAAATVAIVNAHARLLLGLWSSFGSISFGLFGVSEETGSQLWSLLPRDSWRVMISSGQVFDNIHEEKPRGALG